MKGERVFSAFITLVLISIVVISAAFLLIDKKRFVGPSLIVLGFLPWIPLKIDGRSIRSVGADIVFGAIDTGILAVAALIGANYAGVMGAIVGSVVGDSITDGLAGLFEGGLAEYLRSKGIEESRTPLSSSMGKMSGCLIGAGITLTVAWTIFL